MADGGWKTLTNQLYSLLNNNKDALGIQEVYKYPRFNFTGYPACTFYPSDNSNDYETTCENERVYAFKVILAEETKGQGLEACFNTLIALTDAVIDKLDRENELNSGQTIGIDMPASYTFINIFATPGTWSQTEDENLVLSELGVKIKLSFDAS